MAANLNPIFGLAPKNLWTTLTVAETSLAALTTAGIIMTAGADGGTLKKVTVKALGSNAATVIRLFLNNGGVITTAANNTFLKELPLPVTTLSQTTTTSNDYEINFNLLVQAGYKIYATIGSVAAAGWQVTAEWTDF